MLATVSPRCPRQRLQHEAGLSGRREGIRLATAVVPSAASSSSRRLSGSSALAPLVVLSARLARRVGLRRLAWPACLAPSSSSCGTRPWRWPAWHGDSLAEQALLEWMATRGTSRAFRGEPVQLPHRPHSGRGAALVTRVPRDRGRWRSTASPSRRSAGAGRAKPTEGAGHRRGHPWARKIAAARGADSRTPHRPNPKVRGPTEGLPRRVNVLRRVADDIDLSAVDG